MVIYLPNKEPAYVGATLDDREENGYHDSDFYAVVWDEDEGRLKKIVYNSTRYAGGGSCTVDATPEVKEKARVWLADWAAECLTAKYEKESVTPNMGDKVRVIKGRKVAKGTTGILFWEDATRHYTKIGIATSEKQEGGRYVDVEWTYLKNVEVAEPTVPEPHVIEEEARAFAQRGVWCLPFAKYPVF